MRIRKRCCLTALPPCFGASTSSMHRKIDVTAPNRRGRSPVGIVRPPRRDARCACDQTELAWNSLYDGCSKTLLDLAGARPEVGAAQGGRGGGGSGPAPSARASRGLIRPLSRTSWSSPAATCCIDELDPSDEAHAQRAGANVLRACARRAGPAATEVNVPLGGSWRSACRPDFLWRDAGLIIEADSRALSRDTHSAFELRPRARAAPSGWPAGGSSRCTWEQVEREPRIARSPHPCRLLAHSIPGRRA